jgi:hypothetical protein
VAPKEKLFFIMTAFAKENFSRKNGVEYFVRLNIVMSSVHKMLNIEK